VCRNIWWCSWPHLQNTGALFLIDSEVSLTPAVLTRKWDMGFSKHVGCWVLQSWNNAVAFIVQ
jgi:hypothetical protein